MSIPPLNVAKLLKQYGLRPNKSLGQNFLVDEAALKRVMAAAEIEPQDVVLEVGPGLGSLTRLLAQAARRVVAVELDEKLLAPLAEVLAPFSNVKVVQGDILELDVGALLA
ncbi:MAG TPA: rRNA adenine N-6-methyltransferase family protein, partial [Anaerolineales bacterium]|nr:rRNA adenine N-6-methyltransferase family protein [Anaerolineales bacterium]